MEISSDAGRFQEVDIDIELDDQNYLQDNTDEMMGDGAPTDEPNDDEMSDEIDFERQDEELEDANDENQGVDVEVTDALENDPQIVDDIPAVAEANHQDEVSSVQLTADPLVPFENTLSVHADFESREDVDLATVPDGEGHTAGQTNEVNTSQDKRGALAPELAKDSTEVLEGSTGSQEHQEDEEENEEFNDWDEDQANLLEQPTEDENVKANDSPSTDNGTHRDSFGQHHAHGAAPAMSKEQLLKFPVTLNFAGTDNNLFPLSNNGEITPGYLFDDRDLMKKSIKAVFEAFRDRFGEAITESNLLGLEFPGLDLRLNEESPFASEAGCCLLSFIDIYVKLSANDGVVDPPPFYLILSVEDTFYTRWQHLRDACNGGQGLSTVVQQFDPNDSFDEGDYVEDEVDVESEVELTNEDEDDVADKHTGADDNVEAEGDYRGVEEAAEGDTPVGDTRQSHAENKNILNDEQRGTTKSELSDQDNADESADKEPVTAGSRQHEIKSKKQAETEGEVESVSVTEFDNRHTELEEDEGESTLGRLQSPKSATGIRNGSSPTCPNSDEEDNYGSKSIWDNADADVKAEAGVGAANESSGSAREDEESLIDYSDHEDTGDRDPAQHDDQTKVTVSRPSGSDKKRKSVTFDEGTIINESPSKMRKRQGIPMPPPEAANAVKNAAREVASQQPAMNDVEQAAGEDAHDDAAAGVEDELAISYDDDNNEAIDIQSKAAEPPTQNHTAKKSNGSTGDTSIENVQVLEKPATTASPLPSVVEEDLINYDSDSDDEATSKPSDTFNPPVTPKPTSSPSKGRKRTLEVEDLIDYSDDEDVTPKKTKAS